MNEKHVINSFNSLAAQAVKQEQIRVAQEFGLSITNLADYEANRALALEQKLKVAEDNEAFLVRRLIALSNYIQSQGLQVPLCGPQTCP
jgi:sulfite reductase beta subunit-like hemoprotein